MKILRNSLKKGLVTVDSKCFKELTLRSRKSSAALAKKDVSSEALAKEDGEGRGSELETLIKRKFARSFHIREVDSGSCAGCEAEIIAGTNPIYDLQRFGVDFVASPRHADALLVTGPVSKNMELALKKTYNAVPGPKLVITFGDCALNGGMFKDSYYTLGGVKNLLPVSLHVPGCPPKPAELISALLDLLRAAK